MFVPHCHAIIASRSSDIKFFICWNYDSYLLAMTSFLAPLRNILFASGGLLSF
jgi:hypothetical protein